MQKGRKSASIIFIICFYFVFQNSIAQISIIDNPDDYAILNKTLGIYYETLSNADSVLLEHFKKNEDSIRLNDYLERKKNRNDTLYIAKIADPSYYRTFLIKKTYWTRLKRYKHILEKYDTLLFIDMHKQFEKQLNDSNKYFWNYGQLNDSISIKILDNFKYTRKELNAMNSEKRDSIGRSHRIIARNKNIYTFTKPLYSLDNKYAIIVYSNPSTTHNVLFLYEHKINGWIQKEIIGIKGYL